MNRGHREGASFLEDADRRRFMGAMAELPDWGRDGLMDTAVRYGGLRLAEGVRQVGLKYQAAVQGVKRFEQALAQDCQRRVYVTRLRCDLSTL